MEHDKKYMIPVSGMPFGKNEYVIDIDDTFFSERDYSEVSRGNVRATIEAYKEESLITLTIKLVGQLEVACARCNSLYMQPIENEFEIYVKYGEEAMEEADDVFVVTKDANEIDLETLLYEYAILALPIRCVHEDIADCDQDVIRFLNQEEEKTDDNEGEIDPRWAKLNELK